MATEGIATEGAAAGACVHTCNCACCLPNYNRSVGSTIVCGGTRRCGEVLPVH